MKRFLLLIVSTILVGAYLLFNLQFRPMAASPLSSTPIENPDAADQSLIEAIWLAIQKHREGVPALLLFDVQIDHINYANDTKWATAWITPLDPETRQLIPTEPGLVIARQVSGEWQVTLPFDPQWVDLVNEVPDDLISQDEKASWKEIANSSLIEAPLAPISGYHLPWKAGEAKALTQSVGHDYYTPSGSAHFAFDFASIGYPSSMFDLYAAKPGRVSRAVWHHPNGDESYANYLVLEDTTTSPVTYQLYLHLAQESIPIEFRTIGAYVQQGQFIGMADDTGISSGNHLHFHVHTYPYSYWGVSVDITFSEVAINGGRPRILSDLPYCLPTDVCTQTQTIYVSANYTTPDHQAPTGSIITPTQGSTQSSQTILLSGWGTDDASGLAKAQFLAMFNNGWQTIGPLFTVSPFSFTWDVCAAQVPDGPVALALQLEDYAFNKTSPLYSLTHFTKNFTCPTPPSSCAPTTNQVALFAKPDYQGKCVILNAGTFNTPSAFGVVEDNNAESILVGSNIKTTLFSESGLLGRSDTFSVNDANLADNRVGANTVSSLLVQARSASPGVPLEVWPESGSSFETGASLSLTWRDTGGTASFQVRLVGPSQTITSTWQTETSWFLSPMIPGTYTWQIRGSYDTFLSSWSTGRSFQVLTEGQLSVAQETPLGVPYTETFEDGDLGWTDNNTWELVNGTNHTIAGLYSFQYKPGSSNNYDTGGPNAGYLTSPSISLPDSGQYFLRFWYLYTTESPEINWDQRWVQISVNNEPFTNFLQLSDDPMNYWLQSPAISLSAYAGQTIRVRFYFVSLDNVQNSFLGWLVDDISITSATPPNCLDADNSYLQATQLSYNSIAGSSICPGGDIDYYKFQGIQGDHIGIHIDAQSLGSPLDSFVYLVDSDGRSVLAENDDMVLAERTDSIITYRLNRTGTYFIKVRAWDHPSSGGPEYLYNIHLDRDNDDPVAFFTFPLEGRFLPAGKIMLTVSASDPTTEISHVRFFWHSSDWFSPTWIGVEDDWNGNDGWNYLFDTRSMPYQNNIAFYAQVFDWAENWLGTGVWNLKVPSMFFPFILHLP